jgi:hypothetical protein
MGKHASSWVQGKEHLQFLGHCGHCQHCATSRPQFYQLEHFSLEKVRRAEIPEGFLSQKKNPNGVALQEPE